MNQPLTIAGRTFNSRLFVGTGKFSAPDLMAKSLAASGSEIVTMALRRVDLNNPKDHLLNHIDPKKYQLLPNTSGAQNAEEAIRLARLARAAGLTHWIKLEVTPEPRFLLPDGEETLKAAKVLVDEGFVVLPYIQPDPILAKKLESIGTATVMPLAAPIGSNKGIKAKDLLEIILQQANIPIVVDAGLGAPSHAAEAMEMGADAVLVNTAIAVAENPIQMAEAFARGVQAGRLAFEAGLGPISAEAQASSPLDWLS